MGLFQCPPRLSGGFALRCLADSNRRRRFCRPLTKPLIQRTKPYNLCLLWKSECKGSTFFINCKLFPYFFTNFANIPNFSLLIPH